MIETACAQGLPARSSGSCNINDLARIISSRTGIIGAQSAPCLDSAYNIPDNKQAEIINPQRGV